MKRWQVTATQPLAQALREVFRDPNALAEGRVFVDRRRVHDGECPLEVGQLLEVGAARQATHEPPQWLAQERDLAVLYKPSGLVTVPDHHGEHSLQSWVAEQTGLPREQIHATSRLDREVSGVVVFALREGARKQLQEARARGEYRRLYVALAARAPEPASGLWEGPIGRARDPRKRMVGGRDPAPSTTRYQTLAGAAHGALLALWPHTGRTHQLRVHCAHAGSALEGDASYGGRVRLALPGGKVQTLGRIALHAHQIELPLGRTRRRFEAPIPAALRAHWQHMGGEEPAWALARLTPEGAPGSATEQAP